MSLMRSGLAMLLLAAGLAQAAPRCDWAVVRYSAPRLVPLPGHVSVVRLAAPPRRNLDESDPEYKPRSPQETAAFHRLITIDSTKEGVPRRNVIEVYTTRGPRLAWRLDFAELSGNVEIQWLNEDLLFLRAWWGRIVSTDLLFEVSSGRFVYAKEANYGLLTEPCDEAPSQPK